MCVCGCVGFICKKNETYHTHTILLVFPSSLSLVPSFLPSLVFPPLFSLTHLPFFLRLKVTLSNLGETLDHSDQLGLFRLFLFCCVFVVLVCLVCCVCSVFVCFVFFCLFFFCLFVCLFN